MAATELKTVPSFMFEQSNDEGFENSIQVSFWNGAIELEQNGDSIMILPGCLIELCRAIKDREPEANRELGKRS